MESDFIREIYLAALHRTMYYGRRFIIALYEVARANSYQAPTYEDQKALVGIYEHYHEYMATLAGALNE